MIRKFFLGVCWTFLALMWGVQLLALVGNWSAGCKMLPMMGLLTALLRTAGAGCRRREELAAKAVETERDAACHVVVPSTVEACCLRRGAGELVVEADGSLRFVAGNSAPSGVHHLGLDTANTSAWRLAAGRLCAFLAPWRRRHRLAAERNWHLDRDTLHVAVADDRLGAGPSVLIGYAAPGHTELKWEEFMLSTWAANQFRTPTADPEAWVRDLGLPPASKAEREAALAYRARLHRQLRRSETLWTLGLLNAILGAAFTPIVAFALTHPTTRTGEPTPVAALLIILSAGIVGANLLAAAAAAWWNR